MSWNSIFILTVAITLLLPRTTEAAEPSPMPSPTGLGLTDPAPPKPSPLLRNHNQGTILNVRLLGIASNVKPTQSEVQLQFTNGEDKEQ